jgi:uncharacterized repeat protein (TIGR01451 family)
MLAFFTRITFILISLFGLFSPFDVMSQNSIRPFSQMYSENLKGGTTMFGNTIIHAFDNGRVNLNKMNETSQADNGVGGIGFSQYGNDDNDMQFVDIDNYAVTKNSSSADLILPNGTNTIKFARLYWGGKIDAALVAAKPDTIQKIKIRKGTSGNYVNLTTASNNVDQFLLTTQEDTYQAFIDITSFVNTNGSGTYTVADIPVTSGTSGAGGKYGGWVIVVVYENLSQPYNSIRMYDGFTQIFSNGNTSFYNITLTGLNVPATALASNEAVIGTMAWEGDASLGASSSNPAGDFIKINNITVTNNANPTTNFWNGSITKNGAFVSSKNPNYSNQMGIDIDEVNVGTGYNISPNATSINVQFGTEADMYFPSIFTFCVRVKDPLVTLNKTVVDKNLDGNVDSDEELTYTLSGSNEGAGISYNTFIVDSLPFNVTYKPNTLEVVTAPGVSTGFKTDAADDDQAFIGIVGNRKYVKYFIGTGATGTTGGELSPGASSIYNVRFKVKASAIPGTIVNTARIYGNSLTGDLFTDDGTAVIGEAGAPEAPLAVTLIDFKAKLNSNASVLLNWSTSTEINNDYFNVERSEDCAHFINVGKVYANGNSNQITNYNLIDAINSKAKIYYYRLKIVDQSGAFYYSKIIAIKIAGNTTIESFNVFPNPFVSNINLSLSSTIDAPSIIKIISFDGRVVLERTVDVQKGENIISMKNCGGFPAGNYILEVNIGGEKSIRKILKN